MVKNLKCQLYKALFTLCSLVLNAVLTENLFEAHWRKELLSHRFSSIDGSVPTVDSAENAEIAARPRRQAHLSSSTSRGAASSPERSQVLMMLHAGKR